MRSRLVMAVVLGAVCVSAGCGADEAETPAALPPSGTAYRALDDQERLAVATSCRDRAATAARGRAASELAKADPRALRDQLDAAFRWTREQRRPVSELCAAQLPFVTPGLRVSFEGAEDGGDTFTFETDSDIPLRIHGAVTPPPREGTVVARRESGGSRAYRGRIGPDGRFALPAIRLRKVADNTFIVAIHAPPSAPHKRYFSAICLDCLATGAPSDAAQ